MEGFRVLEIKKSVFENNDREADKLRQELKKEKTFLLNLMSSPGSGKTTTLKATIAALKDEMRIGVMEADIDSDVDAHTIAETGAKVIQLHTRVTPSPLSIRLCSRSAMCSSSIRSTSCRTLTLILISAESMSRSSIRT